MPDPRNDWQHDIRQRLQGLRLSAAREIEIVEELAIHLDERYAELRGEGIEQHAARDLALAELDDAALRSRLRALALVREPDPIAPGIPRRHLFADAWQDLRYAARLLLKQRGFTAAAVITLALGIGANTAIFSLINAVLLRTLPVRDSESLFFVRPKGNVVFAAPEYFELVEHQNVFDGLIAWGGIGASLNAGGATDLVTGAIVSGNYFEVLGVQAARGRTLTPGDDKTPGAHPVAVISHGLWQRRFGGKPDVLGQQILLNGHPFTIVGVLPEGFIGMQLGIVRDLYVPLMMQAIMRPPRARYSGEMNPDLLHVRTNRWLFFAGRLKPGITPRQAEAELSPLFTRFTRAAFPDAPPQALTLTPVAVEDPEARAQIVSSAKLLFGVVGLVLLIACANVANLMLSRAAGRRREIAVRLAIGASRARLVRQLLVESVLLALAGGAAGAFMAFALIRLWLAHPPPAGALPIAVDFAVDMRVWLFTFAISIVTGVLFGLAPALRASRPALVPSLKDASFAPDRRARRFNLRKTLVVAQVALSLVLLVAAGLLVGSLRRTQAISPGFEADRLLVAPLQINLLRYTRAQGREFYRRTLEEMQAIPGVESATLARVAALGGAVSSAGLQIEGRERNDLQLRNEGGGITIDPRKSVALNVVGPRYFSTLGIAHVAGRDFGSQDIEGGALAAIVNEAFAALHFPEARPQDIVGTRLSLDGPQGPWRTIVGVVATAKYATLLEPARPVAYIPLSQQHETGMILYVRASDPAEIAAQVRARIRQLEPNLPVPDTRPVTEMIGVTLYAARTGTTLITVFGGLALLLAAVGVYGVMSFSIARRTRELGVRLALGARAGNVFGLVLGEGFALVIAGMVVGLAAAFAGASSLSRFLYGIDARDPATYAAVAAILGAVALAACVMPARRAMKVDPIIALKAE